MWRAMVLAAGLSMCLLGGEFMVVDRLVLADSVGPTPSSAYLDSLYGDAYAGSSKSYGSSLDAGRRRTFVPPEWAPWGFLSAGVLTVLYGTAIPRQ